MSKLNSIGVKPAVNVIVSISLVVICSFIVKLISGKIGKIVCLKK